MRTSLALSIVILAIAGILGLRLDQRLATARALSEKLVPEANRSGVSIDTSNPARAYRMTRRPRATGDDPVRLAADFMAVSRDLKMLRDSGAGEDAELAGRSAELRKRMRLLNFRQAKILIGELKANGSLADYDCRSLLSDLAVDQPQAVLAFLAESPDILEDNDNYRVMKSAVSAWAKEDPHGALDWVQRNSATMFGGMARAEQVVICGVAGTDPKLAFEILGRSSIEDKNETAALIMGSLRTAGARTAALTAYREYLDKGKDVEDREHAAMTAVAKLGPGLAKEGFVAATQWLADAKLTPEELERVVGYIPLSVKAGERGQWIAWIGKNLPPDIAEDSIVHNLWLWSQDDYQAAGKWLAAQPDGSTKNASIQGYVRSVAGTDPETAEQWAMTVPTGKDRDKAIREVHRSWPKADPEGRAAFAKQHGIK